MTLLCTYIGTLLKICLRSLVSARIHPRDWRETFWVHLDSTLLAPHAADELSPNMGHKVKNPTHIIKCLPRMVSDCVSPRFLAFHSTSLSRRRSRTNADFARMSAELVTSEPIQPVPAYLWTSDCRHEIHEIGVDNVPAEVEGKAAREGVPRGLDSGTKVQEGLLAEWAASDHWQQVGGRGQGPSGEYDVRRG